jgi:hypothetical protein
MMSEHLPRAPARPTRQKSKASQVCTKLDAEFLFYSRFDVRAPPDRGRRHTVPRTLSDQYEHGDFVPRAVTA